MMILNVIPIPKPRMTQRDRWSKRPCVLRYYKYCDDLREEAFINKYNITSTLSMTFVLPMPKSWSKKKKREMEHQPHTQRPDLDNLIKAFQDALAKEDSYVHTYKNVKKVWGYEGKIYVIPYISN
jgi:Holliday junction resolvase RusA-like endonuclease